jgi:2-polyprenyl-3-methyl-5-hydroxy-6-metoxy-1,4-benzoquinol methylase
MMDRIKESVRRHWEWRAAEFDNEASHGLLNETQTCAWRQLISRIAGHQPLDALDVGCGTGFLSLLLAELGHRVTGIDIAREMLAMARRKAAARGFRVDFRHADAEAPDLGSASFDLIVERHVLWTLPDPALALESWRQLLRGDARLALIEGHWQDMKPRDEYGEIFDKLPLFGGRPQDEIAELVRARGFSSVTAEPLMEAELWIERPTHPRYLLIAQA